MAPRTQAVDWGAFGRYVEQRRLEQGMRIVDALARSGLSRTKWADVEKNRGARPTRETLLAIARALGDPEDELLARAGIAYTPSPAPAVDRLGVLESQIATVSAGQQDLSAQLRSLRDQVGTLHRRREH